MCFSYCYSLITGEWVHCNICWFSQCWAGAGVRCMRCFQSFPPWWWVHVGHARTHTHKLDLSLPLFTDLLPFFTSDLRSVTSRCTTAAHTEARTGLRSALSRGGDGPVGVWLSVRSTVGWRERKKVVRTSLHPWCTYCRQAVERRRETWWLRKKSQSRWVEAEMKMKTSCVCFFFTSSSHVSKYFNFTDSRVGSMWDGKDWKIDFRASRGWIWCGNEGSEVTAKTTANILTTVVTDFLKTLWIKFGLDLLWRVHTVCFDLTFPLTGP